MKKDKAEMTGKALVSAITMVSLGLSGCSKGPHGSSSLDDGTPSVDGTTTTFSVAVDDGQNGSTAAIQDTSWPQRIAAFFISTAHAAPVDQLDPSQFSVTIIGGAEDGSDRTLDPSEYSVEPLGNGDYEVVVPGEPRFDCYIATDVDGDGSVDLRAPTVAEDIQINPVSEYVTGILEKNSGNFANFNLEEVDAIVDQVQQQVDNNQELRDQIAAAAGDPDAVKTLLDDNTTVTDQFDVAALPEPDNADNLAGDYHFIGQELSLEKTQFENSDSGDTFDGGNLGLNLFHFPATLSLDEDAVELALGNETSFGADLRFTNTASNGLEFESGQSEESGSVPGAVTSLGFNLSVGGDGPQTDGNETETQFESTLNFLDVTGSFEGFVSANRQAFDFESSETDGTFTANEHAFPWFVAAKKRSSFDPSDLQGEWGLVVEETTISADGNLGNNIEALNFSIDSSGVFNFPGTEEFKFGYDTNVRDGSTLATSGGFGLTTGASESVNMNYASDGSFAFNDSGYTTFGAKGVVFPGNQMLALALTGHSDASDDTADEADTTMLFGVPKSDSPKSSLQGKTFSMLGRSFYNEENGVDISQFGTVSVTFGEKADSASLKGVANEFIVDTPADGTARKLSETFSLSGFSVTISPNNMVQVEKAGTEETIELNGFLSSNGQNLVLTLVSNDDTENNGSTGVLVGRCTQNCQ